ncbi:MAG: BlaI/MecI/CopY family transcriptional regulator [Nanoarchaeota archaeon]|jgi:sugar-specific transcriptional regulator TrmB|nr:BlaI/MecI/CopY family transcriptional regulator [Nanoarchaeota archaeon]
MKKELLAIGFQNKDADIYLELMKSGKATILDLTKRTSIERRTIYDVLERLMQKGFVSYFEENKKKIYLPTNPEIILNEFEERKSKFEKIIPQLNSLDKKKDEAKVEVLKGVNGLKTIFLEIISQKQMHYSFGNISPFISDKKYIPVVKTFLEYLEGRGVKEKIIYPKGESINKIKGGQYKSIDKSLIPPTPTIIYGDTTAQFVFTDPITIIKIQNKEITKTHKRYFDTFWEIKS